MPDEKTKEREQFLASQKFLAEGYERAAERGPPELYDEYTIAVPDGRPGIPFIAICGLCGNSGVIGAFTHGVRARCGDVETYMEPRACICPNGRTRLKSKRSTRPAWWPTRWKAGG